MFVGFMRKSEKPSFMAKLISIMCKNQGIELVYMTPEGIRMKSNTVKGYIYINDIWEEVVVPLPKFIDISPHLFNYKKYKNKLDYLKRNTKLSIDERHIILKDELQVQLQKSNDLSQFSIPTKNIKSLNELKEWLEKYETVVLKPVRGLKGNGVYIIKVNEKNNYTVGIQKEEISFTEEKLIEFFENKIKDKGYIIQKYISSRSIYGDPYDCRIHLEKNGNGDWETARMFIRIGIGQKVVSNISQGGAISNPESFLNNNFGEENGREIYKQLKKLATKIPYEIEKVTNKRLMTMGVDVGIDRSGNLYIFEINSFPIVSPQRTEIALLRTDYYKYMLTKYDDDVRLEMLNKELHQIKNSKSWKVTKPLRKLSTSLK